MSGYTLPNRETPLRGPGTERYPPLARCESSPRRTYSRVPLQYALAPGGSADLIWPPDFLATHHPRN